MLPMYACSKLLSVMPVHHTYELLITSLCYRTCFVCHRVSVVGNRGKFGASYRAFAVHTHRRHPIVATHSPMCSITRKPVPVLLWPGTRTYAASRLQSSGGTTALTALRRPHVRLSRGRTHKPPVRSLHQFVLSM